jgi:hypothetical protein
LPCFHSSDCVNFVHKHSAQTRLCQQQSLLLAVAGCIYRGAGWQQLLQLWPEVDEDSQRCNWRLRMGLSMAGVSLLCLYQSVWSIRWHMAQHTRSASSLLHICRPSSMPAVIHIGYGLFLCCAALLLHSCNNTVDTMSECGSRHVRLSSKVCLCSEGIALVHTVIHLHGKHHPELLVLGNAYIQHFLCSDQSCLSQLIIPLCSIAVVLWLCCVS